MKSNSSIRPRAFENLFLVEQVHKSRLLKSYHNKYEASFEIIEVNNFLAQLFALIELFMASGAMSGRMLWVKTV